MLFVRSIFRACPADHSKGPGGLPGACGRSVCLPERSTATIHLHASLHVIELDKSAGCQLKSFPILQLSDIWNLKLYVSICKFGP